MYITLFKSSLKGEVTQIPTKTKIDHVKPKIDWEHPAYIYTKLMGICRWIDPIC